MFDQLNSIKLQGTQFKNWICNQIQGRNRRSNYTTQWLETLVEVITASSLFLNIERNEVSSFRVMLQIDTHISMPLQYVILLLYGFPLGTLNKDIT